jgi:hypothetical protein
LDLPIPEPNPNAYARTEVSRLGIREVECRDPLWWLHSYVLGLRVLTDGEGVEFVCRVKRRLRASVEVRKRAFEYFGPLDRWTRSIRSFAVLVGSLLGVW